MGRNPTGKHAACATLVRLSLSSPFSPLLFPTEPLFTPSPSCSQLSTSLAAHSLSLAPHLAPVSLLCPHSDKLRYFSSVVWWFSMVAQMFLVNSCANEGWELVLALFSSLTSFVTSGRSYCLEAVGIGEDSTILVNFLDNVRVTFSLGSSTRAMG